MKRVKIKVVLANGSEKIYDGIFATTDSNNNLQIYKSGVEIQAVIKASEWKSWESIKD